MNKILILIKKFWILLLLGLIIRLILAATTFHLDVKAQMVASAAYFKGQDPYHFARTIHPDTILDKLPMSYFLDFPLRLPFHFLVDEYKEKIFLLSPNKLFGDPWLFGYLIYTKLPFIMVDLLVALLLAYIVEQKNQRKALLIWMFNPFTLWATTMIGQIDIYVAFFILLSYILITKSKYFWAAFVLGIGGAIKSSPFLLLPLLLNMVSGWKSWVSITTLAIIPVLVSILPYLSSVDFRHDALFAPQISKILYAQIPLSGGESVSINLILILIIYLIFYIKKRSAEDFSKYGITIFLTILAFTHFHLQWILWPMPLILIWLMDHFQKDIKLALGLSALGFLMMLFLFESSLQLKLFAPVFPVLDSTLGLWETLPNEKITFLRTLAASLFATGVLYLSFKLLKYD